MFILHLSWWCLVYISQWNVHSTSLHVMVILHLSMEGLFSSFPWNVHSPSLHGMFNLHLSIECSCYISPWNVSSPSLHAMFILHLSMECSFYISPWNIHSTSLHGIFSKVLVTVLDRNDNSPRFSAPVYDVTVPENSRDINLVTLVATDNDAGENGRVTFTLLNTSVGENKGDRI